MEYQQIAAAWSSPLPVRMSLVDVLERCGGGPGGFVFGTLLGPEATGPGFSRDLCFWFPGAADHACFCVWGVVFGVVV